MEILKLPRQAERMGNLESDANFLEFENVWLEVRVCKVSWKALEMFSLECHAMQQYIF